MQPFCWASLKVLNFFDFLEPNATFWSVSEESSKFWIFSTKCYVDPSLFGFPRTKCKILPGLTSRTLSAAETCIWFEKIQNFEQSLETTSNLAFGSRKSKKSKTLRLAQKKGSIWFEKIQKNPKNPKLQATMAAPCPGVSPGRSLHLVRENPKSRPPLFGFS